MMSAQTKIAIIYMGGTFGCVGEPLSPMPANHFLTVLKQHYPQPHLNFFASPIIKDSTELSASDWLKLAEMIEQLAKHQHYQDFIIIHGTDTLAYASAFLHHLFAHQYRIIFTGSQFPILDTQGEHLREQSDAQQNLEFAIKQISHLQMGVYLAFHQQVFYGNSCYKKHTEDFDAFFGITIHQQTSPFSSLNITQQIDLSQDCSDFQHKFQQIYIDNLYLMPTSTWLLQEILLQKMLNPPKVLFIQGFGSGNLPYSPALKETLETLIDHDCQVVISSQVLHGELSQKYATGSWLNETSVLFDNHISQADSYARVMLLIATYPQDWQKYWDLSTGITS